MGTAWNSGGTGVNETAGAGPLASAAGPSLEVLEEIQQRAIWLAVRMVDAANHDRQIRDGIKVGGHQASSTSVAGIMTALYFAHLDASDKVSVKPHASPVFHAIQYLLGNLDRRFLTTLRAGGGLQAYPSRTKDPDAAFVDFSTGSVGLGAAAPLFAAAVRRYVDSHFGPREPSRFVAVIGDAELDEGNIWEAVSDPATQGLGSVMWVIDVNRQSLDRVVPGVRITQLRDGLRAAGWHTVEVKYGRRLSARFAEAGGKALRHWIDWMENEQYQSLFGLHGEELRKRFLDGAPAKVEKAVEGLDDQALRTLVTDLGGHDLASLLSAFRACDAVTDRPSAVFAYTVKGWGLPIAGDWRNHSALMSGEQIEELRRAAGLTKETEWDRFPDYSPAGRWCAARGRLLARPDRRSSAAARPAIPVPARIDPRWPARASTQEAFGRLLAQLSRAPETAPYLVTTAPDVATSTNLAGFINRAGVFAPRERPDWHQGETLMHWREGPAGQHIELGISEMNLFLLLGQLGLSWDLSGQRLLPVGTVYDPFVCRGLDALIYACYSGSSFVLAGTPSGVTLAPEGGAHQSSITPSIGLELPGLTFVEPAFYGELDWLLADVLGAIGAGSGAAYFRLTTRALDQSPFEVARRRLGEEVLRRHVLAGAYVLHDSHTFAAGGAPTVDLVASGALIPESLEAAAQLAEEGVAANVVAVTSLDRCYSTWRDGIELSMDTGSSIPGTGADSTAGRGMGVGMGMGSGRPRPYLRGAEAQHPAGHLGRIVRPGTPVVTVHDASSHAMAFVGAALGVNAVPLGVDRFGQSGSLDELYEAHRLTPGHIVNAALLALERHTTRAAPSSDQRDQRDQRDDPASPVTA